MAVSADIRRRVRQVLGPVLAAAVIGYFGYHAVEGERGLIAWWQVTQRIKDAETTLERTAAEREALEHRVSLLRPEHLDPDLLDERARVMLDLAAPDEVVILVPEGEGGGSGGPRDEAATDPAGESP